MTIHKKDHPRDLWLDTFCPDDVCLAEEEHLEVASLEAADAKHDDAWLEVFCPEDRCAAEAPTNVV
jgi:hypothetical protein